MLLKILVPQYIFELSFDKECVIEYTNWYRTEIFKWSHLELSESVEIRSSQIFNLFRRRIFYMDEEQFGPILSSQWILFLWRTILISLKFCWNVENHPRNQCTGSSSAHSSSNTNFDLYKVTSCSNLSTICINLM